MSINTPNHNESMISSISSADMQLTPVNFHNDDNNDNNDNNDNTNRITETLKKANQGIALSPGMVNDDYKYLDNLPLSVKNSPKKDSDLIMDGVESTPKSPLNNPVKAAYDIFDRNQQPTTPMSVNSHSFIIKSPSSIIKPFSSKKRKLHSKKKQGHPITPKHQTPPANERGSINKQNKNLSTPTIKVIKDILSDPQITKNITNILQILLNTSLIFIFLTILLLSLKSIKKDADLKIQRYINKSNFRIQNCKREYVRNNCDPSTRVPALESKCLEWENCLYSSIDNESNDVGSTTAYFEIFAECLNAFFHQLSFKSLISLTGLILSLFIIPNVLFNRFKNSTMNNSTTSTTTTNNYYHLNGTSNQTTGLLESENFPGSPMRQPQQSQQPQLITDNTNQSLYYTPNQHSQSKGYGVITSGGLKPLEPQLLPKSETSVRFNPNVSYSFYDADEEYKESDKVDWGNFNQDALSGDSGSPLVNKYVRNRDKY